LWRITIPLTALWAQRFVLQEIAIDRAINKYVLFIENQ
jgi:hypothetical protein